MFLLIQEGMVP